MQFEHVTVKFISGVAVRKLEIRSTNPTTFYMNLWAGYH
jgi:hypothetical protein